MPKPDPPARRLGATTAARRLPRLILLVALAMVLAVGVAVWIRFGSTRDDDGAGAPPGPPQPPAQTLPADPAPPGWRTEYFRDLAFQVPADWGYADEPGASWCATNPDGRPHPEQLRPYVSLGRPVSDAIKCPAPPASLTTVHVGALTRDGEHPERTSTEQHLDGWWVLTAGWDAVVTITDTELARARRIAASVTRAGSTAPCMPTSAVTDAGSARPEYRFNLETVHGFGALVVCQYEREPRAGLRAVARLDAQTARALVQTILTAPFRQPTPCERPTDPDLTSTVRLETDAGVRELYVRLGDCRLGSDGWGGVDDGLGVRLLTRSMCQALQTPPVRQRTGGRAVRAACL